MADGLCRDAATDSDQRGLAARAMPTLVKPRVGLQHVVQVLSHALALLRLGPTRVESRWIGHKLIDDSSGGSLHVGLPVDPRPWGRAVRRPRGSRAPSPVRSSPVGSAGSCPAVKRRARLGPSAGAFQADGDLMDTGVFRRIIVRCRTREQSLDPLNRRGDRLGRARSLRDRLVEPRRLGQLPRRVRTIRLDQRPLGICLNRDDSNVLIPSGVDRT